MRPSERIVVVEGSKDSKLYSNVLIEKRPEVSILPVDAYEVPLLTNGDYAAMGAKARVIELCRTIASKLPDATDRFIGVVDQDCDHFFPRRTDSHLLSTDFSSVELYVYESELLAKVAKNFYGVDTQDASRFLKSIEPALVSLGAVYVATRKLGLHVKRVAIRRYVTRDGNWTLDSERYIRSICMSNAIVSETDLVIVTHKEVIGEFNGDARSIIRGHDFIELMGMEARFFGASNVLSGEEAVRGALWVSCNAEEVRSKHPNLEKLATLVS